MTIDFLTNIFAERRDKIAIVYNDYDYSYSWLLSQIGSWHDYLSKENINKKVVSIVGPPSPWSISLILALINNDNIIIPLLTGLNDELLIQAGVELEIILDGLGKYELKKHQASKTNIHYKSLLEMDDPGLVLFSSGTTGKSKGIVHNFRKLLRKYEQRRKDYTTLLFMQYDHIGGIDTIFYLLSNGSKMVICENRSPEHICRVIQENEVEVLPVTPTFLNLVLLSGAYNKYDMKSLSFITYGAEPMPQSTLDKCIIAFPSAEFVQKYGATEVGTLRSKSLRSNSLWVKIGGENYQTRVIDGLLQIKSDSAMLGYIQGDHPFTDDGWFITGDRVEIDGDYYRIMGRKSSMINVGGEKVFPEDVEQILHDLDGLAEITIFGEENPIVGNIVCAKISLLPGVDRKEFKSKFKKYCQERLPPYKIPVKLSFVSEVDYNKRFKKLRS